MTLRRTTILAEADLLDRLDRHARRTGVTKTAVIAAALEAWLTEHEPAPALPFVGIGHSGHGRLSLDARRIAAREMGGTGSRRRADAGAGGGSGGPGGAAGPGGGAVGSGAGGTGAVAPRPAAERAP